VSIRKSSLKKRSEKSYKSKRKAINSFVSLKERWRKSSTRTSRLW
jgi:hypothetical protein